MEKNKIAEILSKKFEIAGPAWYKKFKSPDVLSSVSDH